MPRFSLSAVGADRPGIVAAISGALKEAGCNLEDSTMAILQGAFAVLLVVSAPPAVTPGQLESALADAARRFDLVVAVRPLPPAPAPADATGEAWVISVHGADRPGIVHAVTAALADAGGNIVDLSTHLIDAEAEPVYVLTMRVTVPAGSASTAADAVRAAATQLGVAASAHRDDADVL